MAHTYLSYQCESININRNQLQARFVIEDKTVKTEPGKMAVKKVISLVTTPDEASNYQVGKSYAITITEDLEEQK